jgi:GGDEF domain-containing protein
MDELLIALAAAAAAIALVASMLALRTREQARRYAAALDGLERELAPISERIRDAVERSRPSAEPPAAAPDPKLEELIERIAADGSAVVALRQLADDMSPQRRPALRGSHADYEAELEREVARARRTGRPLSLVLLDVDQPTPDRLLQLAALLTRVPRVTDTVCRRRRGAFGILLPETAEDGARRFGERLHEEVRTLDPARRTTFSTGVVQWRPNESGEAFDARARAAVESRAAGSISTAADAPA